MGGYCPQKGLSLWHGGMADKKGNCEGFRKSFHRGYLSALVGSALVGRFVCE